MIRFIRLYLRKLQNNIRYHVIITAGLGLALTATLFIFIYVSHEFSYNKFTSKNKQIYRILDYVTDNGYYRSETFDPLSKLLKEKSPYVTDGTRFLGHILEFDFKNEIFADDAIITDPSFFSMFEIQVKSGSVAKFSDTPNGAFISESLSKKYYGSENPEGKTIGYSLEPTQPKDDLTIVGVFKDLPQTSTMKGNLVINMAAEDKKKQYADWNYNYETYILIPEKKNVKHVEESIPAILKPSLEKDGLGDWIKGDEFSLQRFDKVYLHSKEVEDFTIKGNLGLLQILIIVGILILGMSGFNFLTIHSGLV